ncbi:MAG: hypothetical protein IJI73_07895 [Kiritimatiellae bacterium]|nr:hypothetical protein [Kiritimatiellia bacterium]
MTRRRRIVAVVALVFALLGIAAGVSCLLLDRGGRAAAETPEEYRYKPLGIVSAHIALLEKPDAKRVFAADGVDDEMKGYFSHAGLKCIGAADEGRADIVFASGRGADWKRLAQRMTENGVAAWRLDVRNMSAGDFRALIERFPCEDFRLWMPGEHDWMLVGRAKARRIKLSAMLDMFSREGAFEDLAKAECGSLADLFASYVGRREDVMPAFEAGDMKAKVRPEFFVARTPPPMDWIVPGDLDDDIYRSVTGEMRSRQNVRRSIVEGGMLAMENGRIDDAIAKWADAMLVNPHDSMLLDRLYRLAVNAVAFERVGNLKGAAKCYETMVSVRPKDTAAMLKYAACMRALGHKEIAEIAEKRAKELMK